MFHLVFVSPANQLLHTRVTAIFARHSYHSHNRRTVCLSVIPSSGAIRAAQTRSLPPVGLHGLRRCGPMPSPTHPQLLSN